MINFNKLTTIDIQRKLYFLDCSHKTQTGMRTRLLALFQHILNKEMRVQELARYGIERHFYYCDKYELPYDVDAVREIIYDAMKGISQALANQQEIHFTDYSLSNNYPYLQDLFTKGRRIPRAAAA